MPGLTAEQRRVLESFTRSDESKCAYQIFARVPTLDALARRGFLREVNPGAPGCFSMPRTARKFKITDEGRAALATVRGEA